MYHHSSWWSLTTRRPYCLRALPAAAWLLLPLPSLLLEPAAPPNPPKQLGVLGVGAGATRGAWLVVLGAGSTPTHHDAARAARTGYRDALVCVGAHCQLLPRC